MTLVEQSSGLAFKFWARDYRITQYMEHSCFLLLFFLPISNGILQQLRICVLLKFVYRNRQHALLWSMNKSADNCCILIDIASFFLISKAKIELMVSKQKCFIEIIMLEIIPEHKDTYRHA